MLICSSAIQSLKADSTPCCRCHSNSGIYVLLTPPSSSIFTVNPKKTLLDQLAFFLCSGKIKSFISAQLQAVSLLTAISILALWRSFVSDCLLTLGYMQLPYRKHNTLDRVFYKPSRFCTAGLLFVWAYPISFLEIISQDIFEQTAIKFQPGTPAGLTEAQGHQVTCLEPLWAIRSVQNWNIHMAGRPLEILPPAPQIRSLSYFELRQQDLEACSQANAQRKVCCLKNLPPPPAMKFYWKRYKRHKEEGMHGRGFYYEA